MSYERRFRCIYKGHKISNAIDLFAQIMTYIGMYMVLQAIFAGLYVFILGGIAIVIGMRLLRLVIAHYMEQYMITSAFGVIHYS